MPFSLARVRPSPVPMRINPCLNLASPPQHGQHQPAVRRGGVGLCVAERAEAGFLLGDCRERVQQVAGRAGDAVEPRHHHHVAGGKFRDKPGKLRPVGLGSIGNFGVLFLRPAFEELVWIEYLQKHRDVTLLHGSASGRSDPMPSWSQ